MFLIHSRITLFCLLLGESYAVDYNSNDHSYEELLVAISPDIDSSDSSAIIENIQNWVTSGSQVLYTATNGWAYIKNVKILLPANWDTVPDVVYAGDEVFEDAEIRVDTPSPIYGDAPFTIQTGGCGDQGEYIQVSHFSFGSGNTFSQTFGPIGQVFVHEWSKLRYGVFEEHGYPGDPLYPMFFYKQGWTVSGETNTLTPNFCTNYDITAGYQEDMSRGGSCTYDQGTGLPDEHCVYVVTGPNSITSSIMAVPYLNGSNHYCEDSEDYIHQQEFPTKQNSYCQGKSIFSVIKEHPDFTNYEVIAGEQDTTPKFTLIRSQAIERSPYVMVLDASGSMEGTRLDRLKQASTRFVKHTAQEGLPVGVVRFSGDSPEETKILYKITQLTTQSKTEMSSAINNVNANGFTCLGAGIMKGLEALRDFGQESGGVMIFLTDGQFDCEGGLNITDVIEEVVRKNVRVITIAFGPAADFDLETLATQTNGQSYFVPDNTGPEDINTAFSGSLSYLPSLPMSDVSVTILQETVEDQSDIEFTFTIDQFCGKEVKIQADISGNTEPFNVEFSMDPAPNGASVGENITDNFFEKSFGKILSSDYKIILKSNIPLSFLTLKVTSKANELIDPLLTECWSSAGENYLRLTGDNPDKLIIFGRVKQGQRPVIGANMIAFIYRDDDQTPIELVLKDDGQEPDKIKGDGIYSRYFTQFVPGSTTKTRYTLNCQAEGGDTTLVNNGFSGKTKTSLRSVKSLPGNPTMQTPICCGSTALREDSVTEPTGKFKRVQAGGLIGIGETDSMEPNLYPPGSISDLTIGNMSFTDNKFDISFTSPGEDLDQGTVDSINILYSSNFTLISGDYSQGTPHGLEEVSDEQLGCTNCSLPSPEPALSMVLITLNMESFPTEQQIYFRVLATDSGNKTSVSNVARIYLFNAVPPTKEALGLTWGIVFAVFFGSFFSTLLVFGAIFWHKNHYGWSF